MADAYLRHIHGRRHGAVCPCCSEGPKRLRARLARRRLRAEDRREVADRLANAPALLDATERRLAEVEAERDTLRRLCLEAADMLDEPTATGGDAMDVMAARLRAAGGER